MYNNKIKMWNLKEAQEDYKYNKRIKDCRSCKFIVEELNFKLGYRCTVKNKFIEYPIINASICKYFNFKEMV